MEASAQSLPAQVFAVAASAPELPQEAVEEVRPPR